MTGLPESGRRMPYWPRGGRRQAARTVVRRTGARRAHADPAGAEERR